MKNKRYYLRIADFVDRWHEYIFGACILLPFLSIRYWYLFIVVVFIIASLQIACMGCPLTVFSTWLRRQEYPIYHFEGPIGVRLKAKYEGRSSLRIVVAVSVFATGLLVGFVLNRFFEDDPLLISFFRRLPPSG